MERLPGDRVRVARLARGLWVIALAWAAIFWLRVPGPSPARVTYDERPMRAPEPGGRVPGPEPIDPGVGLGADGAAPEASGPSTPGVRAYVIKRGDTLWEISKRTLGRGSRWRELFEANRERIADPDRPPVGVEIVIPGG